MLTRRSLLKLLVKIPFLGTVLPTPSTSSVGNATVLPMSEWRTLPEYITSADGIRNGDALRGLPLPITHSDFCFSPRQVLLDHQRVALRLWPDIDVRWASDNEHPSSDSR